MLQDAIAWGSTNTCEQGGDHLWKLWVLPLDGGLHCTRSEVPRELCWVSPIPCLPSGFAVSFIGSTFIEFTDVQDSLDNWAVRETPLGVLRLYSSYKMHRAIWKIQLETTGLYISPDEIKEASERNL